MLVLTHRLPPVHGTSEEYDRPSGCGQDCGVAVLKLLSDSRIVSQFWNCETRLELGWRALGQKKLLAL
jgi:hypothetical protein